MLGPALLISNRAIITLRVLNLINKFWVSLGILVAYFKFTVLPFGLNVGPSFFFLNS